jgi:UrcA family protein
METTKRFVKYAAIAVMLATASVAAQAQTFDNKTVSVRVYDLDLNKPADAQVLLKRVRHAADSACARIGDSRDFQSVRARNMCQYESYTTTLASINSRTGLDLEAIAALASDVPDVASK